MSSEFELEAKKLLSDPDEKSAAILEIHDRAVATEDVKTLGSIVRTYDSAYLDEITGGTLEHIYDFLIEHGEEQ